MTPQDPLATRDTATDDVAFRVDERVGIPDKNISRLNTPARVHPCQRFAAPSRVANA